MKHKQYKLRCKKCLKTEHMKVNQYGAVYCSNHLKKCYDVAEDNWKLPDTMPDFI